jgi:uncharacterized membrane protein YfcA
LYDLALRALETMTTMLAQLDLLHGIAGLLVGFLVGMTGVGGGSLMTPILVLLFGVSPGTAVGTDLLFAALTKTVGTAVYGRRQSIDWKIVRRLAAGSVPAAAVTIYALSWLGKLGKETNGVILTVLGCMLILTAIATLMQKRIATYAKAHERMGEENALVPTIVLGMILGTVVSITSVGAGAIGVTVLLTLYPALRVARIVGTDIAHAVPLTLVAGFGHWLMGGVDPLLLLNLLIGSIPGVIVGSMISTRSADHILRPVWRLCCWFQASGCFLDSGNLCRV